MGPRVGLNDVGKRKVLTLSGFELLTVLSSRPQPVAMASALSRLLVKYEYVGFPNLHKLWEKSDYYGVYYLHNFIQHVGESVRHSFSFP
jgi:hypothetical protein